AVSFSIFFPLKEVAGAGEVAQRVVAGERLFRIGIAGYILNCVALVVQVGAWYVILEPVDRMLALLAALARLVWAFAWVVVALNLFTVLRLAKGGEAGLGGLYLSGP